MYVIQQQFRAERTNLRSHGRWVVQNRGVKVVKVVVRVQVVRRKVSGGAENLLGRVAPQIPHVRRVQARVPLNLKRETRVLRPGLHELTPDIVKRLVILAHTLAMRGARRRRQLSRAF